MQQHTTLEQMEQIAIEILNASFESDKQNISITIRNLKNGWVIDVTFYLDNFCKSIYVYDFYSYETNMKVVEKVKRLLADENEIIKFMEE